jgi:hypothetical protein
MMGRKRKIWLPLLWVIVCGTFAEATMTYPLKVFNSDVSDLNLHVEVANGGAGQINFSFYNQSTIDSAIARIYFDDDAGVLLSILDISGDGTSFSQPAKPKNLPAGMSLSPIFDAIEQLSIAAVAPPPKNGINPGEHTTVVFRLSDGFGPGDVAAALNEGTLRVGVHVIALPDGSSVSAVSIPEPATLAIFGLAALSIVRKARSLKWFRNETNNTSINGVKQ